MPRLEWWGAHATSLLGWQGLLGAAGILRTASKSRKIGYLLRRMLEI